MRQRLELSMQFDYRRPVEVKEVVLHLRSKLSSPEWAMVECLALEILSQSSVDRESARTILSQYLTAAELAGS